MIAEAIERAGRANSDLLSALERLQTTERVNDKLVLSTAFRALQRCQGAEGLSPSARQEVRSALRMCRAALGLSDE
jgi:hypothetical protein